MDLSSDKAAAIQAQSCQIALVLEDALELGKTFMATELALIKFQFRHTFTACDGLSDQRKLPLAEPCVAQLKFLNRSRGFQEVLKCMGSCIR